VAETPPGRLLGGGGVQRPGWKGRETIRPDEHGFASSLLLLVVPRRDLQNGAAEARERSLLERQGRRADQSLMRGGDEEARDGGVQRWRRRV
jgi:hypothetical protein